MASGDLVESFPTLAVGWLKLDIEFWGEAGFACGSLEAIMKPRLLD